MCLFGRIRPTLGGGTRSGVHVLTSLRLYSIDADVNKVFIVCLVEVQEEVVGSGKQDELVY